MDRGYVLLQNSEKNKLTKKPPNVIRTVCRRVIPAGSVVKHPDIKKGGYPIVMTTIAIVIIITFSGLVVKYTAGNPCFHSSPPRAERKELGRILYRTTTAHQHRCP